MSDLVEHRARWIKNRAFCASLGPEHADWMVTAIFYSSVHAIGALLAADGVRSPDNHKNRFGILRENNRYRQIYRKYKFIYDASIDSRYGCNESCWIPADVVEQDILRGSFFPLEKSVSKLLGPEAPDLDPLELKR